MFFQHNTIVAPVLYDNCGLAHSNHLHRAYKSLANACRVGVGAIRQCKNSGIDVARKPSFTILCPLYVNYDRLMYKFTISHTPKIVLYIIVE